MHDQRTEGWLSERTGRVTASAVYKVMAKTKTGYGADRANYLAELVTERLTGLPVPSYMNAAMQHGIDTEAQARAAYQFHLGYSVTETGFHPHPFIAMFGASPDGLCGDAGLVELKCPNSATHIETLRGGSIAKKYLLQMQTQMACTGRDWCDFVSFDPRMPLELQCRLFLHRGGRLPRWPREGHKLVARVSMGQTCRGTGAVSAQRRVCHRVRRV